MLSLLLSFYRQGSCCFVNALHFTILCLSLANAGIKVCTISASQNFICVCVCGMCTCVRACSHACEHIAGTCTVYACGGPRVTMGFFLTCCSLSMLSQELLFQLVWYLVCCSICLYLLWDEITGKPTHPPAFLCEFWGSSKLCSKYICCCCWWWWRQWQLRA